MSFIDHTVYNSQISAYYLKKKVLIVGANFRNPNLHKQLDILKKSKSFHLETDLFQKSITPKKKLLSLSTNRKPILQWHKRERGATIGVVLSLFS